MKNVIPEIDTDKEVLSHPEVNRPALQLTGFFDHFDRERVQIIGYVEQAYIKTLSREVKVQMYERLLTSEIPCIVYSRGQMPDEDMQELCRRYQVPLLVSDKTTSDLMAEVMRIEPTEFLTRARTITNRYLNTVDFWNVSVNYPSSQKSLQMIRKSFLIDDLKEKMEYNQKQVGNIFDINREIVDRQEAKEEKERDDQSNTALTILSVLCFFSAMIDGNDYLSTLDWLIPAGVLDIILKGVFPITMIGILLYVLKKLYGRSK